MFTKIFFPLAISCFTIMSCSTTEKEYTDTEKTTIENEVKGSYYTIKNGKVQVNGIQVYFDFTDELSNYISDKNEAFIANVEVIIDTEREIPAFIQDKLDEKGSLALFSQQYELQFERALLIKDIVMDQKEFEFFKENELSIEINVFSARKSTDVNVISGGYGNENLKEATQKDMTISCKLLK